MQTFNLHDEHFAKCVSISLTVIHIGNWLLVKSVNASCLLAILQEVIFVKTNSVLIILFADNERFKARLRKGFTYVRNFLL